MRDFDFFDGILISIFLTFMAAICVIIGTNLPNDESAVKKLQGAICIEKKFGGDIVKRCYKAIEIEK
jgi:hypothetical protein